MTMRRSDAKPSTLRSVAAKPATNPLRSCSETLDPELELKIITAFWSDALNLTEEEAKPFMNSLREDQTSIVSERQPGGHPS
tara:strand:- start:21490 stop:21735 length:246 start_codon:yes stop_codon:yes gene_type:complete